MSRLCALDGQGLRNWIKGQSSLKFIHLTPKKLSAPTRLQSGQNPITESEGGLAGLQIDTRLPGGTLNITQQLFEHKEVKPLKEKKFTWLFKEQPRHTASLHQPDDPGIYYYLAWATPPYTLDGSKVFNLTTSTWRCVLQQ